MRNSIKKRTAPIMLLTLALTISACSSNKSTTETPKSSEAATTQAPAGTVNSPANELTWKGTITMYAQNYTPNSENIKGIKKDQRMLQTVADDYEKIHPGIKIKFLDEEFKDYVQTVRVKAAAGELYDIFWGQWAELNGIFPKGIAEDLTSYFKLPNPYIPEKATWQDAMNETVVNETVSADGKHYNINGDYVATAFFYNKDLFDKAGITAAPKTWSELIQASEKLKAAGIVPMSQTPSYSWFQRHFLTDLYSKDFDTIAAYDKNPGISALDQTIAISKGILSTKDERLMGWWPVFKKLTDTWKVDYLTADPDISSNSSRNDFIAGKTAILYDGSWLPNIAKDAKASFTIASFNFPILSTDDTSLSTGSDTSGAVGGPSAAFQFAIATKEANASMKEKGKKEAVLDWLQFVGTPKNVERVVNENGAFIPTWPDTKPNDSMAELTNQASKELKAVSVGESSPNLGKDIQRTFGLYLSGNIDLAKATVAVQKELDAAIKDYQTKNNTDFSKY